MPTVQSLPTQTQSNNVHSVFRTSCLINPHNIGNAGASGIHANISRNQASAASIVIGIASAFDTGQFAFASCAIVSKPAASRPGTFARTNR